MSMNKKISGRIVALIIAGTPLPAAVDEVLGTGTYGRLAGEVYDLLQAAAPGVRPS